MDGNEGKAPVSYVAGVLYIPVSLSRWQDENAGNGRK